MDAAVVDDVGLDHLVAVGSHDLCQRPSQKVVAHMPQMEWFVGVGRRVFYHHQGRLFVGLSLAVMGVGVDGVEQSYPCRRGDGHVEESLHHVVGGHAAVVGDQVVAYFACRVFRLLPRHLEEGEHHECQIALKLTSCLLELHHFLRHLLPIQFLHGLHDRTAYSCLYAHSFW